MQSLSKLPSNSSERIAKLKGMSSLNSHQLMQTYQSDSLPILNKMKSQKKAWSRLESEEARPEIEIKDSAYQTMQESNMLLDNNKKVHAEIQRDVMTSNKCRLINIIKEHQIYKFRQSKMPKIKVTDPNQLMSMRSNSTKNFTPMFQEAQLDQTSTGALLL